ncbi:MAG: hypothetical protein ACYTCU_09300, partial [Planctomycetota bacterium]
MRRVGPSASRSVGARLFARLAIRLPGLSLALLAVLGASVAPGVAAQDMAAGMPAESSCVACHQGIEEMHPWEALSCTDCHGGNGLEPEMEDA